MKTTKLQPLNMLTDPPNKAVIRFAIPIILGNLFQQFYNMADSVVVGKFVGESALASVGASYAITNVFIAIAIGGGLGSSVIISQYFGAKQAKHMKTAIATAIINFTVLGMILSILGILICQPLLTVLNTPENILPQAVIYLRIYFAGLAFLFLYNIISSIFNSLGDSQTPLKLLIFSSVLNIILDILFVAQFKMGVAGVAIATLIAQGFSSVLSFVILIKKIKKYPSDIFPLYSGNTSFKMLRVAIPSIIQQSIVNIGILLVQSVVNGFGSSVLAGYSAGIRFESISIVPMLAIGNAISTFTAQNMGAGNIPRIKKGYRSSYPIIALIGVVLCLIFQLFGEGLLTLLLDAEARSKAFSTGLAYIRFMSFFYIMIGAKACADGVLRGSGDVLVFTLANLVNLAIRVWFAYFFASIIGIKAVWIAVPIGWTANFILSFAWYLTGNWKTKRTI